jgi:hypothetical protein
MLLKERVFLERISAFLFEQLSASFFVRLFIEGCIE